VRADVVFQDNFSGGNLGKWTTVGSPTIVTSPTADGSTHAAKISLRTTNASPSNGSYLQATYPSSDTSTLEFYFLTNTLSKSGYLDVAGIYEPSDFNFSFNGQPVPIVLLSISPQNGHLAWVFSYPAGETTIANHTVNDLTDTYYSPSSVQANVWYKIDIAVSYGSSRIQLSINNSPVFTATHQFVWNPATLRLGNIGSYKYSNGNLYIDDVTVLDTASITQSTSSSTPAPTPAIPELSWLVIVPLLLSVFLVAAMFRHRKTANQSNGLS
jgi:hypothetical protein